MSVIELTVTVPARSLQQRLAALETANEIRTYRARLKRQIKAGRVPVLDVLLDPEPEVETMKILDLLLAVPKFGRVKVQKILRAAVISPSKTVGGLSPRQRAELAGRLSSRQFGTMAA